jgi:hypothetical protein
MFDVIILVSTERTTQLCRKHQPTSAARRS